MTSRETGRGWEGGRGPGRTGRRQAGGPFRPLSFVFYIPRWHRGRRASRPVSSLSHCHPMKGGYFPCLRRFSFYCYHILLTTINTITFSSDLFNYIWSYWCTNFCRVHMQASREGNVVDKIRLSMIRWRYHFKSITQSTLNKFGWKKLQTFQRVCYNVNTTNHKIPAGVPSCYCNLINSWDNLKGQEKFLLVQ